MKPAFHFLVLVLLVAATLPPPVRAALNAASADQGDHPVGIFPIDGHIRVDGTLLEAVNLGAPDGSTFNAGPEPTVAFRGVSGPHPSGPDWSIFAPATDPGLDGSPTTDEIFFSEVSGPLTGTATLTYRNLDPAHRYVVQIGHGEPRETNAARFSNNTFVLDGHTTLLVPSFQLGNGIGGEAPPAAEDLALVTVEITGVSSFTYFMRPAEGGTRAPSLACFQIRDLTATTRVVANRNNSSAGSLRQAIADAADGDTLVFSPFVFNGEPTDAIPLASELAIEGKSLTLDAGNIPGGVIVNGQSLARAFRVGAASGLTLRGLTITRGHAPDGAGLLTDAPDSLLLMENCTITGGFATNAGGALVLRGPATLVNCTVTANHADLFAAAILLDGPGASLRCVHSTVTGNDTANHVGGIANDGGTLTLVNSIVTANTASSSPDVDNQGSLHRDGHNLVGDNTTIESEFPPGSPNANGDHVNGPHGLNIPADNGGPGRTLLPLPGSPAIGSATVQPGSPGLDQRGFRRSGTAPDIGAAESGWNGGTTPSPPAGAAPFGNLTTPGDLPAAFPFAATPPEEAPVHATDHDPATRYRHAGRLNTGVDLTPGVGTTRVLGLALTSAADSPGRDPATFLLLGATHPRGGFTPVASGIIPPFTDRLQTHTLYFPSVAPAYAHYRLVFPTVASVLADGENDSMQISGISLLGTAVHPGFRITRFAPNHTDGTTRFHDLVWTSEPGATYHLDVSPDLETWSPVPGADALPSTGMASHHLLESTAPELHFRIGRN